MDEVTEGLLNQEHDVSAAPNDDLLPKERVTEIVKREKEAAYKKAAREYQAEIDRLKTGQTQALGGMSGGFDEEAAYGRLTERFQKEIAKAQQETQKQQYEEFVKGQVDTYLKKMDAGVTLADDFKEMTSKFKPEKFKEVFYLANSFENTPAIIYELSKNPYKLANIDYLAKADPDLAREQLASIAKSIEANEAAKTSNQSAQPPLSRPKPSLAAGADSGAMGVQDFKKAPWLRG